jgi:hypothetical protein
MEQSISSRGRQRKTIASILNGCYDAAVAMAMLLWLSDGATQTPELIRSPETLGEKHGPCPSGQRRWTLDLTLLIDVSLTERAIGSPGNHR